MARAKALTFHQAAASYMGSHRVAWKNDKHAAQWAATLKTYAYPVLGEISVQAIDTTLIMKVIEPIWAQKPETANRLRGRDYVGARLGNRARLSLGRKPRALARASRQATALTDQGTQNQASQRAALCRAAGVPGCIACAGWKARGACAGIYDPDCCADRRNDWCSALRDQHARKTLDCPSRTYESRPKSIAFRCRTERSNSLRTE